MANIKITMFTTPTCGGCNMLKTQIPKSEFADKFDIQEIGDHNRDFIEENKINSVPTLYLEVGDSKQFVVGYRPIETIDKLIKEMIIY